MSNQVTDPAQGKKQRPKGRRRGQILRSRATQKAQINMLRNLTADKVRQLFEQYRRGEFADIMIAMAELEEYDDTLSTVCDKREAALGEFSYRIAIDADAIGEDAQLQALADAQQQQLSALLATVSNLREAIKWLGSADFRGFAHLLIRRAAGVITLEAVPQWYFNQPTGEEFYLNPEATSGAGELYEVPASLYICRRVPRPIDVVALFACVGKYNGEQGWSSFLDVFGNPAIFVEYPPGTSDERARELAAVVEELIGDARGGIPSGSKIQTVETAARGGETFGAYVEYYNKKIVLKGTGGLLTMLTESGSGTLAGGTHAEAFKSLGNASLQHIAEVLNTQWLEAELRRLFPNRPKLVELVLEYPAEKQQSEEVQTITALSAAGFKLDDAQVEENTGYKVEYREIQSAPTLYETKAVGFRPTEAAVSDMTGLPMEPVPSHILNPRGEGINNRAPEHGETEEPPLTPAELAAFRDAGHVDYAFLNDRAEAAYKALESSALVSAAKTPKTPAARFAKPLQNGASNLLSRARRLFGGVMTIFNRCNQYKHDAGCTGGSIGGSNSSKVASSGSDPSSKSSGSKYKEPETSPNNENSKGYNPKPHRRPKSEAAKAKIVAKRKLKAHAAAYDKAIDQMFKGAGVRQSPIVLQDKQPHLAKLVTSQNYHLPMDIRNKLIGETGKHHLSSKEMKDSMRGFYKAGKDKIRIAGKKQDHVMVNTGVMRGESPIVWVINRGTGRIASIYPYKKW